MISPFSTTSVARSASGLILMNHCVESRGSTTVPQRSHLPMRDGVILLAHQKPLLAQVFEHPFPRGKAAQPGVRPGVLIHVSVLVHDVDLRQVVAQARLEVIGIVRRCHFHRAGAELRIRQLVGDDRNLPLHQRQQNLLPVQMLVAFVLLVDRDRSIAQHRLRTGGGHGDELVRANHGIANLVQLALHLLVLDLKIGNRRLAARTPVDDVLAAINQSFFIQADENLAHGARKARRPW